MELIVVNHTKQLCRDTLVPNSTKTVSLCKTTCMVVLVARNIVCKWAQNTDKTLLQVQHLNSVSAVVALITII